jgi:hypothetical protein
MKAALEARVAKQPTVRESLSSAASPDEVNDKDSSPTG